ncbi:MAG: ATP-binding protein [Clostridia bacterium]|nr:ATP-binding protein [Clostridia bacterium]
MRSEIIQELENEYARRRAANDREADRRQEEAEERVPGLREALLERQGLISHALRGILSQTDVDGLPERMRAANDRVTRLLTANGYPADYLDPIYTCPLCKDTGYTGEPLQEMCACMRGEFYRRLDRAVGLNESREQSFETWNEQLLPETEVPGWHTTQRELANTLRDECREWAEKWPDTPVSTLLLTGQSGLGKTFLMHAMAKVLLRRGQSVLLVSAYTAIEAARKAYFGQGEDGMFQTMMDVGVLMLDDLGAEPLIRNVTIEQLNNLISERQRKGLATVISTNLNEKELKERYTERASSRLTDMGCARVLRFMGADLRRVREGA